MEQRDHGDENDHHWYVNHGYDDLYTPCAEEPTMNMWDYLDVAKEALDIVIKLALIAVLAHLTYLLGILVGTLR